MKKLISIILTLILALNLAACARPAAPAPAASGQSSSYPLTITDQAGREITIKAEPQRLVSCYAIGSSLLLALGLKDRFVGVEAKPDKRPLYKRCARELIDLPTVGSAKEFDLEGCAALEPDLVVLPLRLKDKAETLEELGIQVFLINPENADLLAELITLLGTACNCSDRAAELLTFIDDRKAELQDRLNGCEKTEIYLSGNSSFLSTAGDAMYQSDLIRLAGGTNTAAELTDTYWSEISYEQLLAWDPEYIIMASDAQYEVEEVLADPNLADCRAVKEGKVYRIPKDAENWDTPIPGSILGSVWLAGILHPDQYSETDVSSIIDTYYETFYGFTYSK